MSYVKEKAASILKEAEEIDQKEDLELGNQRGDELPATVQQLEVRKAKYKILVRGKHEKDSNVLRQTCHQP